MNQEKYILLEKNGSSALQDEVNKSLGNGYVLYGPPCVIPESNGHVKCLQALVLPEQKAESQGV